MTINIYIYDKYLTRQDKTRQVMHNKIDRCSKPNKTRQDNTRQDKTRQDKTRQEATNDASHLVFLVK